MIFKLKYDIILKIINPQPFLLSTINNSIETGEILMDEDKGFIANVKDITTSATSVKIALLSIATYTMFVAPAAADDDLCDTELVGIGLEFLDALMVIGPLLGFISGVVGLVMMGQVTSKDKKKKWKKVRNDAFLYGVFGVLIAGAIIELFMAIAGVELACFSPLDFGFE